MKQTTQHLVTAIFIALTLLVAVLLGTAWFAPSDAAADGRPYGGCKEAWQAPKSEGAQWCRDRGWTVRKRIVVSPEKRVRYSSLPSCRVEDASSGPVPCSWNFDKPKRDGRDYWVTGSNESPKFRYVKQVRVC